MLKIYHWERGDTRFIQGNVFPEEAMEELTEKESRACFFTVCLSGGGLIAVSP